MAETDDRTHSPSGGVTRWAEEPVRIHPYDPAWPGRFEEERAVLESAIGGRVVGGIHHVGSTAVPGLEAKPVIDILVGVRDLSASRACFDALAQLGYLCAPYRADEMHWFCKPHPSRRTHHLHLVPAGSRRFRDELAFRDYLRAHPEVAAAYAALKRRLAVRFEHDREAYTEAKTAFIRQVVVRAAQADVEPTSSEAGEPDAPAVTRLVAREASVSAEPEYQDVVVIGAGVAGLSAAHRLASRGCTVRVLEAEAAPGGRARTETWAGCQIELGAVYLTPRYRELMAFVRRLGLADELRPLPDAFRTAVRRDGVWHFVDYASPLGAARFSGLSIREKASLSRLSLPVVRGVRRMRFGDLASAAALDGRTLEDAVSEGTARYYASPPIELFCGYQPAELTVPLVTMAVRFPGRALTLRDGIGTLTRAMAAELSVSYETRVTRVEEEPAGIVVHAEAGAGERSTHRASAVVIATPADAALDIWQQAPDATRAFLRSVSYGRMGLVYFRTTRPIQARNPRGQDLYMQLMPGRQEQCALNAVIFLNTLAPDGGLLLAQSSLAAGDALDDETLADRLQAEFEELHPDAKGRVVERRLVRVSKVVPAFPVGAARRLAAFRSSLGPGRVQLAGDYLYGVWMESAAKAGRAAADRALAALAEARSPAPRSSDRPLTDSL